MAEFGNPPPSGGEGDVWAQIIAREPSARLRTLYQARREFGIAKYGQPVRHGDGRDRRQDLLEELLDATVYAEDEGLHGMVAELRLLTLRLLNGRFDG